MEKRVLAQLLFLFLVVPIGYAQSKIIQDSEKREECVVTEESISPDINTIYYWYKSNRIFFTKGDYGGDLLHGEYIKYSHKNELLEKGNLDKGVKVGVWKKWYPDGSLKNIEQWRQGRLHGDFYEFDSKGKLIQKGKYNKGLKRGQWKIDKDTLRFKKGKVKELKPKKRKTEKNKNPFAIFKKKEEKDIQPREAEIQKTKSKIVRKRGTLKSKEKETKSKRREKRKKKS